MDRSKVGRVIAASIAVVALVVSMTVARSVAVAHDDSMATPHPAHIHAGSCDALGDVVAPLSDVSAAGLVDGTPAAGAMAGSQSAIGVEMSSTTVQMPLADIVAGDHAVNIHESVEEIGTYIACGAIGGQVMGSDLAIGLAEMNDSGYSGVATLHDNGDGSTTVNVFLTESEEEAMAVEGEAVAVEVGDFYVKPATTTLEVGETYTFVVTNAGTMTHELVLEKAGAADEPLEGPNGEAEVEDVEPGASKNLTFTITEPGKYQLACHVPGHFEKGMVVEIEVTG